MLLIEASSIEGKKVVLTVAVGNGNNVTLRLWKPKPSDRPFAGDPIESIVLSARDAAELKRNL